MAEEKIAPVPTGGAAFPSGKAETGLDYAEHPQNEGMTLRDYFAAKALIGVLESVGRYTSIGADNKQSETLAARSYAIADAMIKVRGK